VNFLEPFTFAEIHREKNAKIIYFLDTKYKNSTTTKKICLIFGKIVKGKW
ncbi:hypothetical protein LINPERHAP2_LOCUS39523, partial [Linum perenne]